MYFITIDSENLITGVYNGDNDYVHRLTGEPIENAYQVPDDGILISEVCMGVIRTAAPSHIPKWDPVAGCVVKVADLSVAGKRKQLLSRNTGSVVTAEQVRIDTLSEAELDAELGA